MINTYVYKKEDKESVVRVDPEFITFDLNSGVF